MKDAPSKKQRQTPEMAAEERLQASLQAMKAHDEYWKKRSSQIYELKLQLTDPLFVRINHLRQVFRFYIIPALETALQNPAGKQEQFVRFMPFLFDDDDFAQFLKHFYAVSREEKGEWEFKERDSYKQDELMLYDLYKVKRTMNGIIAFLKDLDQRRTLFPSLFSKKQQIELLKNMNSALFLTFKLSLKPEYQVEIFQHISLSYIQNERIEERRKKGILYGRPSQLDSNPYRRVFFHLLFRTSMQTAIKNKPTTIRYDLVDFEQLMDEYFGHFLQDGNEDLNALQVYHSLHIMGKTLTASLIDDPDPDKIIYEEIDEIRTMV